MDDRDLETGLRRVLRDQSRRVQDGSIPLHTLYAGAARRRARRRAATAVAGASAFVIAVAGFSTWHVLATAGPTRLGAVGPAATAETTRATATPSSSVSSTATAPLPTSTGGAVTAPAVPAGFQAVSVTAVSSTHWWVLGADGLVATTTNGGHTFTLTGLPGLGAHARTVRFANSSDGWAVTAASGSGLQPTLWATLDGGRAWTAIRGLDGAASSGWRGGFRTGSTRCGVSRCPPGVRPPGYRRIRIGPRGRCQRSSGTGTGRVVNGPAARAG